jgi:uncharacterized membrane protein (DUF2068 family)
MTWDWELRSCGRHGHETYRPDEDDLATRLVVDTPEGPAWRCLRCGDFVVGEPRRTGPADHAPTVLRGAALRDAFILRLLAVERAVRGVLLVLLAYGVYKFQGSKDSLQQVFDTYLPLLRPLADRAGIDLQSAGPVKLIEKALHTSQGTLTWVTIGVLAYGCLELVEAVGLWIMKRWGEYIAVVGTGIFIPLEIYELVERVTYVRVGAFILNVFAVVYLLYTKRLFGLRGGKAAFERERANVSLIEVQKAALEQHGPSRHPVTERDPESGAPREGSSVR